MQLGRGLANLKELRWVGCVIDLLNPSACLDTYLYKFSLAIFC